MVNLTSVKLEMASLKNELNDKLRTQMKQAVSQIDQENKQMTKNHQVSNFHFPVYEPLQPPLFSSVQKGPLPASLAVPTLVLQEHQLKNLVDTIFQHREDSEPARKDLVSLPPNNEVLD